VFTHAANGTAQQFANSAWELALGCNPETMPELAQACTGYMSAIAAVIIESRRMYKLPECIPKQLTWGQVVTPIPKYLREHREFWGYTAQDGILEGLRGIYKCSFPPQP
jgi:hypothetical protein